MMRVAALSSPAHLKERTDQMMDHFVEATSRVLYQIRNRLVCFLNNIDKQTD